MATLSNSTAQHKHLPDTAGDVPGVRLQFAQLRVEFNRLGIKQPLAFIRWRRPELTADEVRRIRMGLTGRAAGIDGPLAIAVAKVVEELKAA